MNPSLHARTLIETLPLAQRLALSYAPGSARAATLALLALDERLAGIVRQEGEPILAQIKLAWWRDRLGEDRAVWPAGEPLLALLAQWPGEIRRLQAVVDGWEALLGEELDERALAAFAGGRGQGWGALADALRAAGSRDEPELARAAGARFALVDLALHLSSPAERKRAREAARASLAASRTGPLRSRPLRALAVLQALAARALQEDRAALLGDVGAALVVLGVGIAGR